LEIREREFFYEGDEDDMAMLMAMVEDGDKDGDKDEIMRGTRTTRMRPTRARKMHNFAYPVKFQMAQTATTN
jgi:hypothetical protein